MMCFYVKQMHASFCGFEVLMSQSDETLCNSRAQLG